jgi:hypothetical protein
VNDRDDPIYTGWRVGPVYKSPEYARRENKAEVTGQMAKVHVWCHIGCKCEFEEGCGYRCRGWRLLKIA